jgi:hypothetical protein
VPNFNSETGANLFLRKGESDAWSISYVTNEPGSLTSICSCVVPRNMGKLLELGT